jgi:hypothetical protein
MKVKELIEKLQKKDPEARVIMGHGINAGELITPTVSTATVEVSEDKEEKVVVIG